MLAQIARYNEVWALTNSEDRASVEEGVRESGLENLHIHYVGMPSWMRFFLRFQGTHQFYYLIWQVLAWFAARRLHRQVHFDLFHHVTYANDWMGSFIGAFLPVPYVRGPGGGSHRTPKGFEAEYPVGGRVWEKVRSVSQWVFRHEPVFVKGQSRAQAILVCNNEAELEASKRWPSKTELFPVSGISPQELSSRQPGSANETFQVLTAGSLIRVKGFAIAIRGFQTFALHHPDAELSIIGSGPEQKRLESMAESSGVSDQIHFLGELPHARLLSKMGACDIFLFPSLRDGGGTVVVEAMGMGKPVICLDSGGPGMHINQECGVKITPISPDQAVNEIASALEDLYSNAERRSELGEAARKRAEEFYLWDRLGERLKKLYDRVLLPGEAARAD
ncbi:MAG: glycosyltransferase [Chloroflexi bacterium]|nr:glycosyltransferase [Chloroflexota bacterium]